MNQHVMYAIYGLGIVAGAGWIVFEMVKLIRMYRKSWGFTELCADLSDIVGESSKVSPMTLSDAIAHARDVVRSPDACDGCKEQHEQLAQWLLHLQDAKCLLSMAKTYVDITSKEPGTHSLSLEIKKWMERFDELDGGTKSEQH